MNGSDADRPDPIDAAFAALRTLSPPAGAAERIRQRVAATEQRATTRTPFRFLALAAAIVAAAGAIAVGSSLGLVTPDRAFESSAGLTESPRSAGPSSSQSPELSTALAPGRLARATRDVQIASIVTVLKGQTVYIVEGPILHAGAPSFRLQVFGGGDGGYFPAGVFGWITQAMADDSLIIRNPVCPNGPTTLLDIAAIQPHERMLCFGDRELSFGPVTASTASLGPGLSDRWLSTEGDADYLTGLPYLLAPSVPDIEDGAWAMVTGHFNDPASADCDNADQVVFCREQFHVTATAPAAMPEFVLPGTWRPTPLPPIDGRTGHRMVWTGTEAVIWGGSSSSRDQSVFDGILPAGGAAYDPVTDRWRLVPDAPIPGRFEPAVVWTGSEVVVFGGWVGDQTRLDGAAWDPTTNRWRTIASSPLTGKEAAGAWLAGRLYVVTSDSTAAYDPASDQWTTLPALPIRAGWRTVTVAADRLFVVAFGDGATPPVDWAVFNPTTLTWRHGTVPIDPLQAGVRFTGAGDRVVVETGLTFDPVQETWKPGVACHGTSAGTVWTGSVLLGVTAAWDLRTGECKDLPPSPRRQAPFDDTNGREFPVAVWTGRQYITWSGGTGADIVWVPKDGAVFTPANDLGPCCG
ncbi:MAG: hypothetical protein H0U52_11455 [Chloroflexi bacterium]|nr:hypothetical protein [Chloroflexota bacterium]